MAKPLSNGVKAEALKLRRAGMTCIEVGLQLGVCSKIVSLWGRAEGVVGRTKPIKPKGAHKIKAGDPGYGPACECGAPKALNSAMCRPCRERLRRGETVHGYSGLLGEVWPDRVPFPPVCAQPPRMIRGVLHVETDGSWERQA